MKYFGGIEGGATHSRLVICDENGECCGTTTGLATNHWMVGIPECARRIADMVERAKDEAGIEQETRLTSLGLSLSGCEQEATNRELEEELHTSFPDLAENYVVTSDTMGSVFTASPIGGMVVISGTGSNALLRNPDGSTYTCGGWGNFLGDEGSAWYISHRAMKIVFDDMDNLEKSPYQVQRVWELIKVHFNVETRLDVLSHCYGKFDKPFYASLCKKLAHAADEGDALSAFLFREAGQHIARSIHALLPRVQSELVVSGDLNIVCVGSVWLSWPLLREGLIKELNRKPIPFGLKLVNITKTMAYGACYLGADGIQFPLPRKYSDNFKVMYHYLGHTSTTATTTTTNGTNGTCNGWKEVIHNGAPISNGTPTCNGSSITNGSSVTNGSSTTNGSPVCNRSSISNGSPVCNGSSISNGSPVCNGSSSISSGSPIPNRSPICNRSAISSGSPISNGTPIYNGTPVRNGSASSH